MRQFPHLHALLDFVESVWLESMHSGDERKDRLALDRYFATVYVPERAVTVDKRGQARREPPPGFRDKRQIEDQFDAALSLLSGSTRRRR